MGNMADKLQHFFDVGIMAIVRIDSADDVQPTVDALAQGGIDIIEISLVTPNAIEYIATIHKTFGDAVMIGAGTVLDAASARAAILAGADFIVSPAVNPETITMTRRYGKLSFAGAYTPTECLLAWQTGSDAVKLFPAMPAGPAYLKAIRAPLPQLPLVAVGGVELDNLASWFEAGAAGVAGATNLANPALVKAGRFDEITRTAEAWLSVAREARKR